ncbi:MAG: hypothetical protein JWM91_1616 [Rhodospirillales bacterium]|nr:hypothetical protein [Rhodospirillales bacterium]
MRYVRGNHGKSVGWPRTQRNPSIRTESFAAFYVILRPRATGCFKEPETPRTRLSGIRSARLSRPITAGRALFKLGEELGMKMILGVLISVALTGPMPAFGQSAAPDNQTQNAPGTGGTSKPGVAGLPGSKSGPTETSSGKTRSDTSNTSTTKHHDESKVPGLPGSKSGPTATSPDKGPPVGPAPDKDTHS